MKRRRAPGAGGDGGDLREALLSGGGETSEAHGEAEQQQRHAAQVERAQQRLVDRHRPFDLEAVARFVKRQWAALLRAIGRCVRMLLGRGCPQLSLMQASRLEELQSRVGVPYDPSNALHQEALRELWDLAFPGVPCPGLKDEQWKAMGWQSVDPSSDFRAAGLLGLDSLVYLGRERPALFRDLRHKARGERSSWEYPFGAAGVNVTWMLVELLQLRPRAAAGGGGGGNEPPADGGAVAASPAGCGFLGLLASEPAAFEDLYCDAFDLLDRVWLERRASYMEFNSVLADVRERVRRALAARPRSAAALRAALGLPPLAGGG